MKLILTACAVAVLAGCSAIESAREERDERRALHAATTCTKLGYQSGTPAFTDCMSVQLADRAAADERRRAASRDLLQSSGALLSGGTGTMQTTCTRFGVSTTCNTRY